MAPEKRQRKSPVAAGRTLPVDWLLEMAARSEPTTLVRREILDLSFLCRVTQDGGIIPPCILAYLHNGKLELSITLVHPATPVVSSFIDGSLAPYMMCCAIDIHDRYEPMMSWGGLVVLRRPHSTCIGFCVFNPMTGSRTYLSCRSNWFRTYVLLTAADGIGSSFLLLAANVDRCHESGGFRITARPRKAGGTSWGPVTSDTHSLFPYRLFQHQSEPVVLHGGIIHWLLSGGDQVLTYNICTQGLGTVKLPPTTTEEGQQLLGMSPEGRLRFLSAKSFMVSMWVHFSDGWAKEAVIDVEQKIQSLHPHTSADLMRIEFRRSGERSGAVLLQAYHGYSLAHRGSLIVLDLETKEMRKSKSWDTSLLFEVDLSMQLQAMKIY